MRSFKFHSLPTLSLFFFSSTLALVLAKDSAWNGHLDPGSSDPTKFTPFYVPDGTYQVDSSSSEIHTSGSWNTRSSTDYIGGSALSTTVHGASLELSFSGSGIEVFGGNGRRFGAASVYIDNTFVRDIKLFSNTNYHQQLLFSAYNIATSNASASPDSHDVKLVNKGAKSGSLLEIEAFVVTSAAGPSTSPAPPPPPSAGVPTAGNHELASFSSSKSKSSIDANSGSTEVAQMPMAGAWTLDQHGSTGVAAMQLAIISSSHAIIIDKVEHNPLSVDGHPSWGALYSLLDDSVQPLHMQSNSFCAGGTFLSNGTLINVGGNPVVSDKTAAADFGDVDGLQGIRLFHPCDDEDVSGCDIYENHARIRMASPRWYNTVLRIQDGSAMIVGGSKKGGWMNNATTNNPTIEYYPPKNIQGSNGLPVNSQFLNDTLNSNLFPIAFALPGGKVFLAANQDAMIYDWQNNIEQRLPLIPNGVRVTYPMTGTGLLLPLSAENNYTPEILLCGGSTIADTKPGYEINSQDPASAQCSRLVLTDDGIKSGWSFESMPDPRIMPDAVLLPTGQVLIVNGGATGISGYANVINQVGQSNADNPVFTPALYDPAAPTGRRFSKAGMPTSDIPRLYHSVATLTPNGSVMIAGSNPNLDRSAVKYGTEYRVEWLSPPYMSQPRPSISGAPAVIGFGQQVTLNISLPVGSAEPNEIKVACMDLGFVTHAVHANSRLVYLHTSDMDGSSLSVHAPPDGGVYPPGPAWLYLVVDGVPSVGVKVIIGDGQSPPVDEDALNNVLNRTIVDQYEAEKHSSADTGE